MELPGSGGYKYFGAAKDLPGVRELFFRDAPTAPKRNLLDLHQLIDYEYYGLQRHGNDELKPIEDELEEREREAMVVAWIEQNREMLSKTIENFEEKSLEEIKAILREDSLYENWERMEEEEKAHQVELDQLRSAQLLEEKKRQLIEKHLYEFD